MIEFIDYFGVKRGISFSLSYCGKYINKTDYVKDRGNTIQIPRDLLQELIDNLNHLKKE